MIILVQHGILILLKNYKKQTSNGQNKYICFCLQLDKNITYISKRIWNNWLPIKERYNPCVNSIAFKYFHNHYPQLFEWSLKVPESSSPSRNSYQKLQQLFRKTNLGQNALPFIGPALWNKVPEESKRATNLNAFKHSLKKHYLKELGNF